MPACPRKHAVALAACLGLGCQPVEATLAMDAWPWLRAHGGSLGCYMPRPWQLARWGLPWSWVQAVSLALAVTAD